MWFIDWRLVYFNDCFPVQGNLLTNFVITIDIKNKVLLVKYYVNLNKYHG